MMTVEERRRLMALTDEELVREVMYASFDERLAEFMFENKLYNLYTDCGEFLDQWLNKQGVPEQVREYLDKAGLVTELLGEKNRHLHISGRIIELLF